MQSPVAHLIECFAKSCPVENPCMVTYSYTSMRLMSTDSIQAEAILTWGQQPTLSQMLNDWCQLCF